MISFSYYTYIIDDGQIKSVCRHNGKKYVVSPWSLTWDDEYYYLLAHDENSNMIKHFRGDKMADIFLSRRKRKGKMLFGVAGITGYTKSTFSMFGGDDEFVRISCDNKLIGAVVDRYGSDLNILKENENRFIFTVKVKVSPQFFSWVFSFGKGMEIIYPDNIVAKMKEHLSELLHMYSK